MSTLIDVVVGTFPIGLFIAWLLWKDAAEKDRLEKSIKDSDAAMLNSTMTFPRSYTLPKPRACGYCGRPDSKKPNCEGCGAPRTTTPS